MRKRHFVTATIILSGILFSAPTLAQSRKVLNLPSYDQAPYHFGFILAANHMLFSIKPVDNLQNIKWSLTQSPDIFADSLFVYEVTSSPTPGFSIGIVSDLRLGNYSSLRFVPTLSFGERIINYSILAYQQGEGALVETTKSVTSTYVEFPLSYKYRSRRLNNMSAYLMGGIKYTLDLASQKKAEKENNDVAIKIYRHDFAAEVGVGFDFYTTYFKFGTQVKMGYGLRNLIRSEDNMYSGSIDQLRSKVFLLSFTFE